MPSVASFKETMFKAIIKRFTILLLTLPVTLLILEFAIRVAVPQQVEDLAYEDVYTERYSPSLNDNVMALEPGITRYKNNAEVHINNQGNRDYEYSQHKNAEVKRIAIVGSSVAFGFNLELEDTFGKQLEILLNEKSAGIEYEVLLFGRPGFKVKETYAYIKDEILNYDPDLVIYSFVQNNYAEQSPGEFFSRQDNFIKSQENSDNIPDSLLGKIRKEWRGIREHDTIRFIRRNFHLYLFATNSVVPVLRDLSPIEKEKAQNIAPLYSDTPEFKQKESNTEAWISLMRQECKDKNIRFAILMHPYEMQINKAGVIKWSTAGIAIPEDVLGIKTHLIMEEFSEEEGILFFDIVPDLRSYTGNEHLFIEGDYGHYDVMGHTIIGKYLAEEISRIIK
jgi:hypothetical protein